MSHIYLRAFKYVSLFCLLSAALISNATVTVDSVHVTLSSCPNNGTAKVYAHSTNGNAVFLFSLTTGPVTYPEQNDSTFYSLYPGSYTGFVHDVNSFDSTMFTFVITGHYNAPDIISVKGISPVCLNGNDGVIIARADSTSGLLPYTWQIYQPYVLQPQLSDTFNNLVQNNYVIRITDACNISRTVSVNVDSGGTGLAATNNSPFLTMLNCNTAVYRFDFYLDTIRAKLPLKVTVTQGSVTTTRYITPVGQPTVFANQIYNISDTLHNVYFGEYLHVCVTDTCGVSFCELADSVPDFAFGLQFSSYNHNCRVGYGADVELTSQGLPYLPLNDDNATTALLVNEITHAVADSVVLVDGGYLLPVSPDTTYMLEVYDVCGNSFHTNITWPGPPSVSCRIGKFQATCLDSTAQIVATFSGFGSYSTFTILSGPPISASTKPGFAYRDTLIYPMVFAGISQLSLGIQNIPLGTYVYRVTDSCSNVITDSFKIYPYDVTPLHRPVVTVNNNCNRTSTINIAGDFLQSTEIHNAINHNLISTDVYFYQNYYVTQSAPVGPGKYILNTQYQLNGYAATSVYLPGNNYCWSVTDTVIIPYYNDSTIRATDVATCNGTIYLHIEADSANGALPFTYEIINGPQTAAGQVSPTFIVNSYGTYLMGIIDSCGNVDARYVTVDTGRFDPIVRTGGLCAGSEVKLYDISSPFFTYVWTLPNGHTYTGDTLAVYPLTNADTGVYSVKKIVQINGCRDSAYGSYHLTYIDTFMHTVTMCAGGVAYSGGHAYTTTGYYTDTLTGSYGCDSILILNLTVNPLYNNTTHTAACFGDTAYFNGRAYTSAGVFSDTFATIYGCDSISTLNLTFRPQVRSVIHNTICSGQSIYVGPYAYTTSGTYTDTLTAITGCDSIVVLTLMVYPTANTIVTDTICQGDIVDIGPHGHSVTGNYTDTLLTIHGCDSIVMLNLTVYPIYNNTSSANICYGDTAYFNGRPYTTTGRYTDTLSTVKGCDSITSILVTAYPLNITSITDTICNGDSISLAGIAYTLTGTYTDTLSTVWGCDSMVVLFLTVRPAFTVSLNDTVCSGDSAYIGQHGYSKPGNYADTMTSVWGCDSVVNLTLTVNSNPLVSFTWDSLENANKIGRGFMQSAPYWCPIIFPYQFTFSGGNPPGGVYSGAGISNNIFYGDSVVNIYVDTITYTYQNNNGCEGQVTTTLQISICEGVQQLGSIPALSIYPNPTTGQLLITTQNFNPQTITIYDDAGRLLNTLPFKNETDITALSSGVYFVEVKGAEGVVRKRVVKF